MLKLLPALSTVYPNGLEPFGWKSLLSISLNALKCRLSVDNAKSEWGLNPYVCKDISGSVDSLTLYKHSLALYHETATSVSSKELENDLYLSCKAFRPLLTEINVFCKYFTSGIICKDSTMSRIDTETVSCLQNWRKRRLCHFSDYDIATCQNQSNLHFATYCF